MEERATAEQPTETAARMVTTTWAVDIGNPPHLDGVADGRRRAIYPVDDIGALSVTAGAAAQRSDGRADVGAARFPSRSGARGPEVQALQLLLVDSGSGPGLKVDGEFGATTEQAVQKFQSARRLRVTGLADLDTWCVLVGSRV